LTDSGEEHAGKSEFRTQDGFRGQNPWVIEACSRICGILGSFETEIDCGWKVTDLANLISLSLGPIELSSASTGHGNSGALRTRARGRWPGLGRPRLRGLPALRAARTPRPVHLRRTLRQDWHVEGRSSGSPSVTTCPSHRGCASSAPGSPTPGSRT
jgi:hypothetical protein